MKLRIGLVIVCITMFFATCPVFTQTINPGTEEKYPLTRLQLEQVKMALAENETLKAELSKCDSVENANERINSAAIKILQTDLMDKKTELQLKDEQIRKLEAVPRQTVVVDKRGWWEVPAAIIGGTVVGIVIKSVLIK